MLRFQFNKICENLKSVKFVHVYDMVHIISEDSYRLLCESVLLYRFQRVEMNLVDFSKTDEYGRNIFESLLDQGIAAYRENHSSLENLMSKIEEIFFFFTSVAAKRLGEEKINRILESPDDSGHTVFLLASYLSKKISGWILDRNIDVAFVDDKWLTPVFWFDSNFEKMLKKGINPFVVPYSGTSEFDLRNFEKIDQKLLESFITGKITDERTEAFYSFQDSECNEKCENSCNDKMVKFKLYTGRRNFKTGKRGGEGIVCFGTWHREPAARVTSRSSNRDFSNIFENISGFHGTSG